MSKMIRSVVFIDANVSDIDHLLNGVLPGVSAKLLDATINGIDQITDYLKAHPTPVVHIVSHGAPGRLFLGNNQLDLSNLEAHASALASWFTPGQNSTLLLYGCNVAAGDAGEEFIEKLHRLTGADIGASSQPIGNGTWHLNVRAHGVRQPLPFASAVLATYPHTFATFTVDIADDEEDGNTDPGDLSLREAIALANATPEADTITFGGVFTDGNTSNDTITLASQLTLSSDITIDGSGGDPITISGGNATRVFSVSSGATVALQNLTIANGQAQDDGGTGWGRTLGGGVINWGILSLEGMTLSSNTADDGGGLYNQGSITTLNNSTFSGNSADFEGGGILNNSSITSISNTTFDGNSAAGRGGGIANLHEPISITNTTFSGNTADYGGGAYIRNMFPDGNMIISNNTFSGNSAQEGGGMVFEDFFHGSSPSITNNLFADSPVVLFGEPLDTTNLVGTAASLGLDPVLRDNGGPTQTHALLPGSPAIDAAVGGTTTDQRGVAAYGTRDIGAYEYFGYAPFVVVNTNDSGFGSLRWAIDNANAIAGDDIITFGGVFTDGNTSNDTITLASQLTLSSNITINGSSGDPITISGNNATRVFSVDAGATVALQNLTITNGAATDGGGVSSTFTLGGGLFNQGTLSLTNTTFSGNSANQGGGLYNYQGTITTLTNSTFSGNSADFYGGGLYNDRGTITALTNNTFSGNSAGFGGGGIHDSTDLLHGSSQSLTNNLFADSPVFLHFGEPLDATNLIGTAASLGLDPVLRDNGGPTQTHALLPYSPAIDAAVDGTTTDQRGISAYGTRDIGAYEVTNHAPTSASDSVTFDEDTAYAFQPSNFAFTDSDSGSFSHLKITALPTVGTFFLDTDASGTLNGSEAAILLDQVIPVADLGQLTFRPAPDANGVAYATFSFKVGDGISFSTIPYTMTLDVANANDAPTGTVTISGTAIQGQTLIADTSTVADDNGLGAFSYQWQQSSNGTTWIDIEGAVNSTLDLRNGQVGKFLRVSVSYVDGNDTTESLTSAATTGPVEKFDATSDFNGDGSVDLFWQHREAGQLAFWFMNNANLEDGITYQLNDAFWRVEAVGDLNGDQKPDLVFQHAITNDTYAWIMDGTEIIAHGLLPEVGPDWDIVETGDFNNDGQDEILWQHVSAGQLAVWDMQPDGLTLASGNVLNKEFSDSDWEVSAVADFTKNGNMDIIWRHRLSGQNAYWNMEGENFVGGDLMDTYADTSWTIQGAADLNQDGNMDLLWENIEAGQNSVWFMNGLTFNGGTALTPVDVDWVAIV